LFVAAETGAIARRIPARPTPLPKLVHFANTACRNLMKFVSGVSHPGELTVIQRNGCDTRPPDAKAELSAVGKTRSRIFYRS
jgi:hypothetical protein